MGRTLKRVPLDFSHPWEGRGKTWPGYLNPHSGSCPDCQRGYTDDYEWLDAITQLLVLLPKRPPIHPWLERLPTRPRVGPPTPAMETLISGLAKRTPSHFGYDEVGRSLLNDAIIQAAGLDPDTWSTCTTCAGSGSDPATKAAADAWEPTEPPVGEGYQCWETTSEGSPISPVFPSLDGLCEWLESTRASWFGNMGATKAQWMEALGGDGVSGLLILNTSTGALSVDGLDPRP